VSTDETALESNTETEGTSDLSSVKTASNTGQQQGLQQGPQAQQGADADGSAVAADQEVNKTNLNTYFSLVFTSLLNLKFIFWIHAHAGFPVLCTVG